MGTCLNNTSASIQSSSIIHHLRQPLVFPHSAYTAHLHPLTALAALWFSILDVLSLPVQLHSGQTIL